MIKYEKLNINRSKDLYVYFDFIKIYMEQNPTIGAKVSFIKRINIDIIRQRLYFF
jgi:hypothetical protein